MYDRIGLASQCCFAVAKSLHQAGVSVAITAFPGDSGLSVVPILRHGDKIHTQVQPMTKGLTPMGEALWWVLQCLVSLREERKIVLIITDGVADRITVVQDAIKTATAIGTEIYGIGIDAPQIGQILPRSSRNISALQELPQAIFSLLGNALVDQGRAA
jgi:Mg-chelatase subunit ChlD